MTDEKKSIVPETKAETKNASPATGGQISKTELTKRLAENDIITTAHESLPDEIWNRLQLDVNTDIPALINRIKQLQTLQDDPLCKNPLVGPNPFNPGAADQPWKFLLLAQADMETLKMAQVDFDAAKDEIGMRPIHYVAFCGKDELFEQVVNESKNITYKNDVALNAAHYAAAAGHYERVGALVKKKPDDFGPASYPKNTITPLQLMAKSGSKEGVEHLIKLGFKLDSQTFTAATRLNNTSIINYLLEYVTTQKEPPFGLSVNEWSFQALLLAVNKNDTILIDFIFKIYDQLNNTFFLRQHLLNSQNLSALFSEATKKCHFEALARLIQWGCNPYVYVANDKTVLHLMAESGCYDEMLQLDTDVAPVRPLDFDVPNRHGETPLFCLARGAHPDHTLQAMVTALEADPKATDRNGRNLLFALAEGGYHLELVEFAKTNNLDLYATDHNKCTLLTVMAENGHFMGVVYLITQHNFDIATYGRGALYFALKQCAEKENMDQRHAHYATVACLIHLGCDTDAYNPYVTEVHLRDMDRQLAMNNDYCFRFRGLSALQLAAFLGDTRMMQHLILLGCNPFEQTEKLILKAAREGEGEKETCINFCVDTAHLYRLYQVWEFTQFARELQKQKESLPNLPLTLLKMIFEYLDPSIMTAFSADIPQNIFSPDPLMGVMITHVKASEPAIATALSVYQEPFYQQHQQPPTTQLPPRIATASTDATPNQALYQELIHWGLWDVLGPLFQLATSTTEPSLQQIQAAALFHSLLREYPVTTLSICNKLMATLDGLIEQKGKDRTYYDIVLQSFLRALDEHYFRMLQQGLYNVGRQHNIKVEFIDDITFYLAIYSYGYSSTLNECNTIRAQKMAAVGVAFSAEDFFVRVRTTQLALQEKRCNYIPHIAAQATAPVADAKISESQPPSSVEATFENSLALSLDSTETKTASKKPAVNAEKLNAYFSGSTAPTGDINQLLETYDAANLGQSDTINKVSLDAAIQALHQLGLGLSSVQPVFIDKLSSLPAVLAALPEDPKNPIPYKLVIIPTNNQGHAVAAVIDTTTQPNNIYMIDSEMNRNGAVDEITAKLAEIISTPDHRLSGANIFTPPDATPAQQKPDDPVRCGIYAFKNLIGIMLGLRYKTFEELEQVLKQEGVSSEAIKLIRAIYISHTTWTSGPAPNDPAFTLTEEVIQCCKIAMLLANDDANTQGLAMDDKAREFRAEKDRAKQTASLPLTTGYSSHNVLRANPNPGSVERKADAKTDNPAGKSCS